MRRAWLPLLALPCSATAQFHMEGFLDFEHINAYLFDHDAYGAKDVTLHLHWGSYIEEPTPPNHSRIQLKWFNDTTVSLTLDEQPTDTLFQVQHGWKTREHLASYTAFVFTETDSAGWHIARESHHFPYGDYFHTTRSWTDSLNTVQVVSRSWSDGRATVDTTYTGTDGIVIRVQRMPTSQAHVRTTRSSLRMTEVIPGFHFPTKLLADDRLSVWTYDLDRKGRLRRVDHVRYEGGDPLPSAHDHVLIEYGR